MKTAREHWNDLILARSLAVETIAARDAEHIAESKAREEAMRATIERLGKDAADKQSEIELLSEHCNDRNAMAQERDRLKGELAEARELLSQAPLNIHADSYLWFTQRRAKQLAVLSPAESTWASVEKNAREVAQWPAWKREGSGILRELAKPTESTGYVRSNCDGCARQLPIERGMHKGPDDPWDVQMCTANRYEPAAPPDDIRERLEALHADIAQRFTLVWTRIDAHARRLKDIEEAAQPVAPQARGEAGHAFVPMKDAPNHCSACVGQLAYRKDHPIHAGAKP